MLEQGKSERSPPEVEGAVERTCDELTVTHKPIPLCHLGVGGRRKRSRSEIEPGKKGGVGGR